MRDASRDAVRSDTTRALARPLAVALVLGCALLGVGAVMHPVLTGDAAHDLRLMADTRAWRAIHLLMLAGSGLVVVGVWVRLLDGRATAPAPAMLLAVLGVIALGQAINALNTAYMAGAGLHMATMFRAGRGEMASLFDATHPIGLMAARFGNFLVALGALALGWVERQDPSRPAWLAWLAWAAAAGGLVGVLFFDEHSRAILGAVALLSGWELGTAWLALRRTRQT